MSPAGPALSLIKAVLELVADRRTGVLEVRADGLRTRIFFDDGKPVFAEDEALGESFGRLLMRQGVISNDQFVRVIDEMTRAAAGNSQLRFGEVAVGLGVLTEEQVERGLAEQVCGIIARSLQRGESEWTFEVAPGAAKPPRSFSLEITPAVVAELRASVDRSKVAEAVAARPEELVIVAGPRATADVGDDVGEAGGETRAARMAAEQAFQRGLGMLRAAKTASAAIELRRASELQPESLEYLLYATWARARSYREIPLEADQQALLEIAQRAKRHDPMFAFASYVVGQLAMWAGDDATAKKFFYEALRLDPASEAAKQVRILARRGPAAGGPAPVPVDPTPGDPEPAPSPSPSAADPGEPRAEAAAPAARPSSSAPAAVPKSPAPRRPPAQAKPWAGRLLAGAAILAMGAIAAVALARRSPPQAGLGAVAAPPPVASDPAPAVDAERKATATNDLEPVKKPPDADAEKAGDDVAIGTVVLPARAAGHRIYVDGRRVKTADDEAPLRLRCGRHVVQIGSSGTPEPIDLPCGGELQLQ